MKKLILVQPPLLGLLDGFSFGLISLANYVVLNNKYVEVDLLDFSRMSFSEVENRISEISNDVDDSNLSFIGITTTTATYQAALFVAKTFKKFLPKSVIIFGGPHATADYGTILKYHRDIVDVIVIGEGEKSLNYLLQNYPKLELIPGIAYVRNNRIHKNSPPPLLTQEELDSIPVVFKNKSIGTPGKFNHITYVSSRGCLYKCSFCAVGNNKIRSKSIKAFIRDIEILLKLGFKRIAIEDNFFVHSLQRAKDICKALIELKKKWNFTWDCQTRVESLIHEDIVYLLEAAGCEAVYIGVESFNFDHLIYLNKTKNPEYYIKVLLEKVIPNLMDSKIECYLNLQFGLPNETTYHVENTISILESIGQMALNKGKFITIFPQLHVIYPGTPLFYQELKNGLFPEDIFEYFTKWEMDHQPVIAWLGEHFAHGAGGLPIGILDKKRLKDRVFDLQTDKILAISYTLKKNSRLPGIKVFNYGDYIVSYKLIGRGG